jgi:hypothetical protein
MDPNSTKELKLKIIKSARRAVRELIKVAEEEIIVNFDVGPDGALGIEEAKLAADKMKNAAAAKKLAIFDAFEILDRIDQEAERIKHSESASKDNISGGFAEKRSRS